MNSRPRSSNVPIIGYELSSGPAASSTLNPGGTRSALEAGQCRPECVRPNSMNEAAALNRIVATRGAQNLRKLQLVNRVPSGRFPCSSEMLSRLVRGAPINLSSRDRIRPASSNDA